jgi:hypothetical protein
LSPESELCVLWCAQVWRDDRFLTHISKLAKRYLKRLETLAHVCVSSIALRS